MSRKAPDDTRNGGTRINTKHALIGLQDRIHYSEGILPAAQSNSTVTGFVTPQSLPFY